MAAGNRSSRDTGGGLIASAARRGARSGRTPRWRARGRRALGACLLLALAACGGGGSEDTAEQTPAAAAGGDVDARASILAASGTAATAMTTSTSTSTAWTDCAIEGRTCAFTGTQQVRYGALSSFVILTLTGGTACTNAVFTDPVVGTVKSCATADVDPVPAFTPENWTLCATEGGTCSFTGSRLVRYGTASQAVTQLWTGQAACTNAVFGDPAYGTVKSCWSANPAGATAPPDWIACAGEGQRCSFTGTRSVRYGAGSSYATATYSNGVDCSNGVFGDPLIGTYKSCSYSSSDKSSPSTPPSIAGISLPAVTAAVLGAPTQLIATVVSPAGVPVSGAAITWSVADPTVAALSSGGVATPLRAGYTSVTASAGGQTATGVLTVRGSMPIPTRSRYVGTNLGGIAYYGTNFPFADLMKSSGGFTSRDDNGVWDAPFPSRSSDGYPTSLAAGQHALAAVAWSNTHYPAGQYTVLWDGDGRVSFPLSNVRIVSSTPGRIVLEPADPTSQMWVGIDATNPSNPVRNLRFLWPGTEATYASQPFNPAYLAKIAPFSMLRFMDWGATNGSPIVQWSDRSLPSHATYSSPKGVPIEVMIDLANLLHVDPWFCIPHMANDDYIRQFASLLHNRLDPTLRPHIEYSNEVWNTGFSQSTWASTQSDALGLQRPWGMPSIFYARRSVQIFKLMQQVYGSTDAHRLVRVLAGQSAWTQFLENALADGAAAANADVMAIAPYFNADSADNPANATATLALSPSQIVDQMLASIRGGIKAQMTSNAALASRYHLKLRAYESGPGDSTRDFPAASQGAMTALMSAANASPRMKDVYNEYYAQWKAVGGDTMNQYYDIGAWTQYGFWGSMQYVTDDPATAPKYQGLLSFIAANATAPNQTTLRATSWSR